MYLCSSVYTCASWVSVEAEERIGFLRAGHRGGCELPHMVVWVIFKSSKCSLAPKPSLQSPLPFSLFCSSPFLFVLLLKRE